MRDFESRPEFIKIVDELVWFADYDPKLAEGIRWLDEKAQKEGISFYEIVFRTLYKHDVNDRAKDWLTQKGKRSA